MPPPIGDVDLYKVLGVSPDATSEQVRSAYRRLAKKYHPDANPNDATAEERFKQLADAYRILSDSRSRLEFHEAYLARARAGFNKVQHNAYVAWQEFYKQGGKRKTAPKKGADIVVTILVTLEDIANGGTRTIKLKKQGACRICGATGIKPGFGKVICPVCNGVGDLPEPGGHGLRFITCMNCQGEGTIVKERCLHCNGTGREWLEHNIVLQIPQGLPTTDPVVRKGQGHMSPNSNTPGDLLLKFIEAPHRYFLRNGGNLAYDLVLTPELFFLGGDARIPTLGEPIYLRIPAGIADGKTLKINLKGLPGLNGGKAGDLFVTVRHRWPATITPETKELLLQLTNRPDFRLWMDEQSFCVRSGYVESPQEPIQETVSNYNDPLTK
ncbi:MAG: DnaJ domain-containing protein [bacterium]|nr:DnaJ domain-containing protein [bacterium]